MSSHINALQDVLTKRILQVIEWSERKFKRIVMSYDADNNPAELYGVDGVIKYRKAGGVGVEIGAGTLWETGIIDVPTNPTAMIYPIAWTDVCVEDMWIKDTGYATTSEFTIWSVDGGGGGGHPHESVE